MEKRVKRAEFKPEIFAPGISKYRYMSDSKMHAGYSGFLAKPRFNGRFP